MRIRLYQYTYYQQVCLTFMRIYGISIIDNALHWKSIVCIFCKMSNFGIEVHGLVIPAKLVEERKLWPVELALPICVDDVIYANGISKSERWLTPMSSSNQGIGTRHCEWEEQIAFVRYHCVGAFSYPTSISWD